jgi:hypothetical protein
MYGVPGGVVSTFVDLLILMLFYALLKRWWGAVLVSIGLKIFVVIAGTGDFMNPPGAVLTAALSIVVLVKAGVLANVVMECLLVTALHSPVTLDTSLWYAPLGFALFAIVLAAALFGFYTSLAGQPLFGRTLSEEL